MDQKLLNSILKQNSTVEETVAFVLGFSVKLSEVTDELDHKNTERKNCYSGMNVLKNCVK